MLKFIIKPPRRKFYFFLFVFSLVSDVLASHSRNLQLPQVNTGVSNEGLWLQGICGIPSLNPCVFEANCRLTVPIVGEAICICPNGFKGNGKSEKFGGTGCVDIDECAETLDTCNRQSENCINESGSYQCTCKDGFIQSPDRRSCIDIDECQNPYLNNCNPQTTTCRNLEGSFQCDCLHEGMTVDKESGSCRDLDECNDLNGSMNGCDQICVNEQPGYSCLCNDGWILAEDGKTCKDLDECLLGTHMCNSDNGISQCQNLPGSYRCACNPDMGLQTGDDQISCINLNECITLENPCGSSSYCCMDLPPPQRYACFAPNSSFNAREYGIFNFPANSRIAAAPLVNGISQHSLLERPTVYSPFSNFKKMFGGPVLNRSTLSKNFNAIGNASNDFTIPNSFFLPSSTNNISPYESGCFVVDTIYSSRDSQNISGVNSVGICQDYCYSYEKCQYFSFDRINNECMLHSLLIGNKYDSRYISGPKNCAAPIQTQIRSGSFLRGFSEYTDKQKAIMQDAEMKKLNDSMLAASSLFCKPEYGCIVADTLDVKSIHNLLSETQNNIFTMQNQKMQTARSLEGSNLPGANILNSIRSSCPDGSVLLSDVQRINNRQKTVSNINTALFTGVDAKGNVVPLSPEAWTDAIVKNTDMIVSEVSKWFTELSAVPGEMAATAGSAISGLPTLNAAEPLANAMSNPTAQAGMASLATGLITGAVTKAVYDGGPGGSKYLDRSGQSKYIAYGID